VRAVIAKSYSRIHWQNLSSFGVLPLSFVTPENFDSIEQGDELSIEGLVETLKAGDRVVAKNTRNGERYELTHELSERQVRMVIEGGLLNMMRQELAA
jgi:aconitate hydratase